MLDRLPSENLGSPLGKVCFLDPAEEGGGAVNSKLGCRKRPLALPFKEPGPGMRSFSE